MKIATKFLLRGWKLSTQFYDLGYIVCFPGGSHGKDTSIFYVPKVLG